MQTVSNLYKEILQGNNTKLVKVLIDDVEYREDLIWEASIKHSLYTEDSFSVGGTCSAELNLKVTPQGTIPRMAEIKVYVAVTNDYQTSEWLPHGVYYIFKREENHDGTLSIIAYDAMLKSEQVGYSSATGFPMAMDALVSDACTRMGVTLDSGTTISSALKVEYDSTLSLREYLSYVALAHGGNWTITPDGKLKLVKAFSGIDLLSDENYDPILFGGVAIIV